MKKMNLLAVGITLTAMTSCGMPGLGGSGNGASSIGNILGGVIGAATNGQTIGNVLGSVLGTDKPSEGSLYGTWRYAQPGVAFTSDNLLAKAGGEVAATTAKQKLASYYQSFGIRQDNTQFVINRDKTFQAIIGGRKLSGSWTYDEQNQKLTMKALLFSLPVYAKRTATGMSFLMESKKLLTIMQTLAAATGNKEIQGVAEISKNYDGVRVGFDMSK